MKLLCRLRVTLLGYQRGHRWQPVLDTGKASVCLVCLRCRENGWLIR